MLSRRRFDALWNTTAHWKMFVVYMQRTKLAAATLSDRKQERTKRAFFGRYRTSFFWQLVYRVTTNKTDSFLISRIFTRWKRTIVKLKSARAAANAKFAAATSSALLRTFSRWAKFTQLRAHLPQASFKTERLIALNAKRRHFQTWRARQSTSINLHTKASQVKRLIRRRLCTASLRVWLANSKRSLLARVFFRRKTLARHFRVLSAYRTARQEKKNFMASLDGYSRKSLLLLSVSRLSRFARSSRDSKQRAALADAHFREAAKASALRKLSRSALARSTARKSCAAADALREESQARAGIEGWMAFTLRSTTRKRELKAYKKALKSLGMKRWLSFTSTSIAGKKKAAKARLFNRSSILSHVFSELAVHAVVKKTKRANLATADSHWFYRNAATAVELLKANASRRRKRRSVDTLVRTHFAAHHPLHLLRPCLSSWTLYAGMRRDTKKQRATMDAVFLERAQLKVFAVMAKNAAARKKRRRALALARTHLVGASRRLVFTVLKAYIASCRSEISTMDVLFTRNLLSKSISALSANVASRTVSRAKMSRMMSLMQVSPARAERACAKQN
jgi:hypothetical protein